MALRDVLRKAAGLIVELPPEETGSLELPEVPKGTEGEGDPPPLDELLAVLDEHKDNPQTAGAKAPPGAVASGQRPSNQAPGSRPATKTVEQIVRDTKGPNLEEIKVAASPPAPVPAGEVDLAAVYRAANLPAAPFSAEQMLEMLASLPSELPLDTKRKTVKVTLSALGKTMGATPETIVADASRKLAALNAYAEHVTKQTDEFIARSEKEIAALQAQMEAKRQAMQSARQKLAQSRQKCDAEAERLDDVLEFFSLDVAPSKYATPQGTALQGAAPQSAPGNQPKGNPPR
jgi:hypothetical protein